MSIRASGKQGLVLSLYDPCLFLSKDLIVIAYVDDLLVYGRDEASINSFVDCMTTKEEVKLQHEGTAENYLSVDIKRNKNKMTLIQYGRANRVVEALGIYNK